MKLAGFLIALFSTAALIFLPQAHTKYMTDPEMLARPEYLRPGIMNTELVSTIQIFLILILVLGILVVLSQSKRYEWFKSYPIYSSY